MKRIIYGVISLCLIYCASAISGTQKEATATLNDLHLETKQLHCEIESLRKEICRLKKSRPAPFWRRLKSNPTCYNGITPFAGLNWQPRKGACGKVAGDKTETGFADNNREFSDFARMWGSPKNLLLLAALGSTVTTSPFLGLRSAFDASDLIVNLPTMNEDLRFLKEEVLIEKKLKDYCIELPDRPIIELGGKIEGIFFAQDDWKFGPTVTDIDIGSARLDVLVRVCKFVHAFMAFSMDPSTFNLLNNANLDIQLTGSGSRIFNSRVFISRSFVTVGNLDCSPLYLTVGQMFVPFGRYASNMVTSVLTLQLARINERALLLGYYKNGFYASVYGFKGPSTVSGPGVNAGGVNIGYEKKWAKNSLNIGAGYVGNIADATGFQVTGNSVGFPGFALHKGNEFLERRVPAADVHAEISVGKFTVFAEYVAALSRFDILDLRFNCLGAKPTASNFELAYNFKMATCPASLAVGYGETTEALALGLARSSFITTFNISIWKNTIESLEYRHDTNYNSHDFCGGASCHPDCLPSVGGSRNTYTAQLGVYF
jgi:hypothetical protein